MNQLVSVIIPTYNCAEFLPEAIESVLSQTFTNWEAIVVDDGSTDDTRVVVRRYMEKDDRIRYLNQANQGPIVARNLGIANARGTHVAFLDADDVWTDDKLRQQIRIFEDDPSVALVYGDVSNFDGERVYERDRKGQRASDRERQSGMIFPQLFRREVHIPISTVIVKKACFDDVGPFDIEMKKMCSEDRDMWLRITYRHKACYIDQTLAYFRLRSASRSRYIYQMMEGQRFVIEKAARRFNVSSSDRHIALSNSFYEASMNFLRLRDYHASLKYLLLAFMNAPAHVMKPYRVKNVFRLLARNDYKSRLLQNG